MKALISAPKPEPVREATKLSEEPGFVVFDLRGVTGINIPSIPGLLGFLRIEDNQEAVTRILMLDDLAKGFLDNIRFAGGSDRVVYIAFPPVPDFNQRTAGLTTRLELFARLTAKYQVHKNSRTGLAV